MLKSFILMLASLVQPFPKPPEIVKLKATHRGVIIYRTRYAEEVQFTSYPAGTFVSPDLPPNGQIGPLPPGVYLCKAIGPKQEVTQLVEVLP